MQCDGHNCSPLKEAVSRDFRPPGIFPKTIPPYRAQIRGQNLFRIWLRIRRENRFEHHQNFIPRCQWHNGVWIRVPLLYLRFLVTICMGCLLAYFYFLWFTFKGNGRQYSFSWMIPRCHKGSRGLIEITRSDLAVSLTPPDPILWSHWHRGIWSSGVNDIAESASPVSLTLWNLLHKNVQVGSNGLIETAGSDPVVSLTLWDPIPWSHIYRRIQWGGLIATAESELYKWLSRFSRRTRSHLWNGFSPWIRALGGMQKTEGRTSCRSRKL
jgi:hypothetical protein